MQEFCKVRQQERWLGHLGAGAKEFRSQTKGEQRVLKVCFAFFLMVLTTYPKAFVLLLGSIKSLSSPCPFPVRAQLLMGLRVSLKLSSRAERNYLELEGPPHLPSVPIALPPYFTGGKLSVKYQRNYKAHWAAARKIPLQWQLFKEPPCLLQNWSAKRTPKWLLHLSVL